MMSSHISEMGRIKNVFKKLMSFPTIDEIHIIIQARMSSTRLPGKVMMPVLGKPLLEYQLERVKRVKKVTKVAVATTQDPLDNVIEKLCMEKQVTCIRGSTNDVLRRYRVAAEILGSDIILRVTADCPLIDPELIDQLIVYFIKKYPLLDYASNCLRRTYPRGMDAEIFTTSSLKEIDDSSISDEEREHVTLFYIKHPEKFHIGFIEAKEDMSHIRLTVDYMEDFELIKRIVEELYPENPNFTLNDVISVLSYKPEWLQINAHVKQK